jgi:tRNA A-37 threonylcarbamoyl transferase component Bud32
MNADPACPQCGKQLSIQIGEDLCSRCMLQLGLDELTACPGPDWAVSIPATIGEYEVIEPIARGGMGVVVKARQPRIGRIVAVKIIRNDLLSSPGARTRFRIEVQSAGSLRHPNIVTVYEANEDAGQEYFSMELVEGDALDRILADQGPLEPLRAARLLAQIAEGVDHAHSKGVLHRDLKPGNVLLDEADLPRVTDFGIALRPTEDDVEHRIGVAGTPSYMAPEQISGRDADITAATDVYGLGAILYETLTGRPPYHAVTPDELLIQVLDGPPERPRRIQRRIPRDLEAICLRCLQRRPEDRYATAAELAADLRAFVAGNPLRAARGGHSGKAIRWLFQRPALALTYAALALFLADHWLVHGLAERQASGGGSSSEFHLLVNAIIPVWALVATGMQLWVERTDRKALVRYSWSALDVVLLTVIILQADGAGSKETLLPLYLIIIAATGFRWRPGLTLFTTALCMAATLVVFMHAKVTGVQSFEALGELFIPLTYMVVMGIIAAALVKRMRVLAGFSEARQ